MVKKFRIGIIFMIISAVLSATGQFLWKIGLNNFVFIAMGFLLYGLGSLFMIKAFAREKLSIAYPVMCVGYIISMIYGGAFLKESITIYKVLAVILITLGVFLCSHDK